MSSIEWDVFICHAFEDKPFVSVLANALRDEGLRVWYDDFTIVLGDSLRGAIDNGLKSSRFGVVVLSPNFFRKKWTQYELDGLVQRDIERKVILPIWHELTREDLMEFSPSLANKVAISSARPLSEIVSAIKAAIRLSGYETASTTDKTGTENLQNIPLEKPRLNLLRDFPTDAESEEKE
jgi:hypothetical protein